MNYTQLTSNNLAFLPLVCLIIVGCGAGAPSTDENNSSKEIVEPPNVEQTALEPYAPELQAATQVDTSAVNTTATETEIITGEADNTATNVDAGPTVTNPEAFIGIESPENFGPFSDYVNQAIISYNGWKTEEPQTLESSQTFLNNALFGIERDNYDLSKESNTDLPWIGLTLDSLFQAPLLQVRAQNNNMPLRGKHDCFYEGKNGTVSVELEINDSSNDQELWQYTLDYDNCSYLQGDSYTGKLHVEYMRNKQTGKHSKTYIGYDNITISGSKGQYEINGASKWLNSATCGLEGKKTFFVNIKNLSNGENVLYENYATALVANNDSLCESNFYKPNYFHGRILNSYLGVARVSTPTELLYSIEVPKDGQWESSEEPGKVTIEAGIDTVEFSLSKFDNKSDTYSKDYSKTATVKINHPSSGVVKEFTQLSTNFWQGGFSNLKDSDVDGMIDSWELLHGLNPFNPTDSQSDEDGDAVPAIMEYEFLGDPGASERTGQVLDRNIDMELVHGQTNSRDTIEIVINKAQQESYGANDSDYTVTVVANTIGQWNFNGDECVQGATLSSAECLFTESATSHTLFFTPAQDGLVEFSATTDVPENDIRPNNNSVVGTADFKFPQTNYKLSADEKITIETNQELTLRGSITQTLGDNTSPLQVTITHPPEVTIVETRPNENTFGKSCQINSDTSSVVCAMNYSSSSIDLTFAVSEPGVYEISWQLDPVDYEVELSDNAALTRLVVQNGVGELQALIDNALPGDTVTLPSGEYVGELSLRKKQLVLQGASGDTPTVLRTADRFDFGISEIGSNSIIRNIHFKVYGSAITFEYGDFLTVADNVFEPDNASVGDPTRHFRGNSGLLIDSGLYGDSRNASFRFINNKVQYFGGEGKLSCNGLINVIGWRDVYIEHNVFTNNSCPGSFFTGEDGINTDYEENIYISNNTFVDVNRLYGPVLHPGNTPGKNHTTYFVNNILVNVDSIIDSSTLDSYIDSNVFVHTENNLLFESERDKIVTDRMIIDGNATQLSPDLTGDPQFDDKENSVYTLKADSPAIDTGAMPSAGNMGVVYDGEPLYLDGNLDGVITPDIGAFEFNPLP